MQQPLLSAKEMTTLSSKTTIPLVFYPTSINFLLKCSLTNKFECYQAPEQAGFRRGYSTFDRLQAIRIVIEKNTDYKFLVFMAFVDYKKSFDLVEPHAILEALHNAGINHRHSGLISFIDKAITFKNFKLDDI